METWWEDRSLPQKILLGIGFGILGVGLLALFGWVVMLLWNWLMPELFGLKRLGYWQAWGLLALCTILFMIGLLIATGTVTALLFLFEADPAGPPVF